MVSQMPAKASVHGYVVSDRPSEKDTLGFQPYVDAVASFLTDSSTDPPLALSVEGDWGSGKTSFMKQLEAKLKGQGYLTIWFDPWRHEKDEALWASFALDFIRQAARERLVWFPNLRLRWYRFQNADHVHERFRAIGAWIVDLGFLIAVATFPLITAFLLKNRLAELLGWNSGLALSFVLTPAALLTFLLTWLTHVRSAMVNVLSIDLKRYVKDPRYQDHISLISRFHEDFKHLVSLYAGSRSVCVFIDDLDRCDSSKAADLMHAINLMVMEDPPLYMVIGMDRAKIAAAYAVKNEKLLAYLSGTGKVQTETQAARQRAAALEHGYTAIEKFIQLSFTVPTATEENLERLLHQVMEKAMKVKKPGMGTRLAWWMYGISCRVQLWMMDVIDFWFIWWHKVWRRLRSGHTVLAAARVTAGADITIEVKTKQPDAKRERRLEIDRAGDSAEVKGAARMVAPVLDYNPRRLKQFINLLRLRAWIAHTTGLFDEVKGPNPRKALTFPQLGKLVAISLKWPALIVDLQMDSQLLDNLHRIVVQGEEIELPPGVAHWVENPRLRSLLRQGCFGELGLDPFLEAEYGLESVDIKAVLQVSPLVPPPPKKLAVFDEVGVAEAAVASESFGSPGSTELDDSLVGTGSDRVFLEGLLTRLSNISPEQFESFASEFLHSFGIQIGNIVFNGKDRSFEGHGGMRLGLVTLKVAFKFSNPKRPVGRPAIDEFRGAIVGGNYEQGVFFSTSGFTNAAIEATVRQGTPPIILYDGQTMLMGLARLNEAQMDPDSTSAPIPD